MQRTLLAVFGLIAFLLIWEAVPYLGLVSPLFLPPPSGLPQAFLREIQAGYALPNVAAEAARAEELDRFCADLDVQIGVTLLKSGGAQIVGTRLRGVAEAAGFKLSAAGQLLGSKSPNYSPSLLGPLPSLRSPGMTRCLQG